ncbi:MAG: DUF4193 family protein [Acidimicrobiales bacterium]
MQVIEYLEHEQQFFEGEPELEPPEELAIGELDEEAQLEEEIDNEDVLEQDVDEDVLEATLEDIVHHDDVDEGDSVPAGAPSGRGTGAPTTRAVEQLDVDDVEESLDRILQRRLAGEADGDDARSPIVVGDPEDDWVQPCCAGEFICRGCFLVRHRAQLADPLALVCRDCAT